MKFTLVKEKTEVLATEKQGLKNLVPDYYKNSFELHNNYMDDKQALKMSVEMFCNKKGFYLDVENISRLIGGLSFTIYPKDSNIPLIVDISFTGEIQIKDKSFFGNKFQEYFVFSKAFQNVVNDNLNFQFIKKKVIKNDGIEIPSIDKF